MFGRIRIRPSSSPHYFEDADPPSKFIKHDSLSIYEATLIKLKQGSQHSLSSTTQVAWEGEASCASASVTEYSSSSWVEAVKIEPKCTSASLSVNEEEMMVEVDDSSTSNSASTSDSQSTRISKRHQSRNASVLYLFSKYKNSKHVLSSSHDESITANNDSSASFSPSSSEGQSLSGIKKQMIDEYSISLALHPM